MPEVTPDIIKRPPHYTHGDIEPIEVIEDWKLGHHEACIVKYIARWKYKGGVEDLRKAQWYLQRLIDLNS